MKGIRVGLRASLFFGSVVAALAISTPARACLGEFRSFDWLVGESALIFVGTIEKVENVELGREDHGEDYPEEGSGPSIATVRIARVIHGVYAAETIRLRSGPVAS